MYQVQVKNGKRIYTKAPIRRETHGEFLIRRMDQIPPTQMHIALSHPDEDDSYTINADLTPGKAKFIKDVCR